MLIIYKLQIFYLPYHNYVSCRQMDRYIEVDIYIYCKINLVFTELSTLLF
jgi:hypothetical protein